MDQVGTKQQFRTGGFDNSRQAIQLDAALDGISPRWTWAGFWFPPATLVALGVLFGLHRPWYYTLQQEDYPIEWTQFGLVLFSGPVFALAALRHARAGRRGLALLLALTALGSILLAGEEISWGQRVFGMVTPASMAEVNHQGETNMHNINVGLPAEDLFKLFAFAMGVSGTGLSLLARRARGALHRTTWWLVAPPLLAVPGFLAMALYRIVVLVAPVAPLVRGQEWAEAVLYTSLAITAGCCYARAGAGRYQLDLTDGRGSDQEPNPQIAVPRGPLIALGLAGLLVTVIFAIMTTKTGIQPGNL